jgi:serine/threonine protein phosphatase PrpC
MDSNYEFCLTGSYSDVGRVRKANEDNMGCFDTLNGKVVVVCDGMGGHVGGQIASQTAVTAIHEFLINNVVPDPREAIHHAITAANTAILNRTQAQPELSGMGSTCVMLIITPEGKVYYGHVGDSRIYLTANHRIKQLTKDHSFVQMLVDAGQITPEQAEHHPRKNEITNALGISNMQPPTVCSEPIEPEAGNCFILCSDGLTGMVDDTHIERIVSTRSLKIQQRAEKLVQLANEAGGVDNITVQLVEFALSAQDIHKSQPSIKKWRKLLFYIIPVLLILGGAAAWWCLKKPDEVQNIINEPDNSSTESVIKRDTTINLNLEKPYIFFKDQTHTVKLFDNDTIWRNTIGIIDKKTKGYFKATANGNCIELQLIKDHFTETSVQIKCQTDRHNCTITIPVRIEAKASDNTPQIFKTDTVTVEKGKDTIITIIVPFKTHSRNFKDKKFSFDDTERIVGAEINFDGDIAIDIKKGVDIPEKIELEGKINGQSCKIIIPVKVKKEVKEETPVPDKDKDKNGKLFTSSLS